MNIPQRQLQEDTIEFSVEVNALLSFNLLQQKIQFCDSLLASSDLTKAKKISITKCKMNLSRLYNFMKSLD